jgi:hypothetical protein
MTAFARIEELEDLRRGRVIVFGTSGLDIDLLPPLYDALRGIGRTERLNVVIYCRGGAVNAARRLALLLHGFTEHLSFIVPHFCESAGTVMALAAREIVAGPLAIFSPIDPHLTAADATAGSPPALSSQDIRLFWKMGHDWFGLEEQEARHRALSLLCDNIFPTTLTSFHRCTQELQAIGNELLALHMPERAQSLRARIVDTLLFDFHSHTYALTGDDVRRIGLPVTHDPAVDNAAWEIACAVRAQMGAESRESLEHDWHDALIVTREGASRRRRRHDAAAGVWEAFEPR